MGWRWAQQKDGPPKLGMDGHHANTAGEYLGACVFYEVLFGESVVGNAFVPPGLDPAYAKFLQETAHQAVTNEVQLARRCSEIADAQRPHPCVETMNLQRPTIDDELQRVQRRNLLY